jgi:uncharacterized protein (DUF1697 family)
MKTIAVALLRGINVGGNAKVSMIKLKETFEKLGLENVLTYINSGNVIFETSRPDLHKIREEIEEAIEADFGFTVPIVVRDVGSIAKVIKKTPEPWKNDNEMKTDVMFLWEEVDTPEVLEEMGIMPDLDSVMYEEGAVIWHVKREDINKSGLLKLIGTKLYKQMTVRNVNTLRKLHSLMTERAN